MSAREEDEAALADPDIRSIRVEGVGYAEFRRGTVGYYLLGLVESQPPATDDDREALVSREDAAREADRGYVFGENCDDIAARIRALPDRRLPVTEPTEAEVKAAIALDEHAWRYPGIYFKRVAASLVAAREAGTP